MVCKAIGFAAALIMGVSSPAIAQSTYTEDDFTRLPKFDAHVHANGDDPALLDVARADGFELLSINVDYPDFPPLAEQARIAEKFHKAAPEQFFYATTFPMDGFGKRGWQEKTIRSIDRALAKGALGVKVWKNIGMVERDPDGRRLFLDDERFSPVIRDIQSAGVPLIAHQGEPRNAWLPVEQMTTDNDREYFAAHPQYHSYLHPEEPSYEMIMATRDRFVAFHPDLPFVGAHLASLEWNVDRIATFLDRFPNATVDMAARMSELQNQSRKDYDRVRSFLIEYQDRILYGTDLTASDPNPDMPAQNPPGNDDFAKEADRVWRSDWRYLATGKSQHIEALKADVKGLALPKAVIDKIYYKNARRVYLND